MRTRSWLLVLLLIAMLLGIALRIRGARDHDATPKKVDAGEPHPGAPTRALRPLRLFDARAATVDTPTAPFSLEGRVLSTTTGLPVTGALLTFGGAGTSSEVSTTADGHFVWSTAQAGPHQLVSITARGFVAFAPEFDRSPVLFNARPGLRLSDITLFVTPEETDGKRDGGIASAERGDAGSREDGTPRGRVVGSVRDGTGKPVVAFSIIALVKKGAIQRGDEQAAAFFDSEGRYAFDELRTGGQCLTAVALGHAASTEQCVEVPPGGEVRVDFQLGRGARLSGRVLDRQSRSPLARARVSLESQFGGEDLPMPVIASAETGADGRFELSGLAAGTRSIFVTAAGHHHRVVPGIELDPDRPPSLVEVDLLATDPGEAPRIESAGINVAVRADGDRLVIDGVSPGGGAAEAGLQKGDVLVRVDGVELASLGMQAGIERLRGPEGSTVQVTIQRPPTEALRDVVVTRRRIVNR